MEKSDSQMPVGFRGTQVRDDGQGPMLVAHRQKLLVVRGPDQGLEKEINSPRLTIGSAPTNDFVLTDATVSRRHCEVLVRDDRYLLRDLGSTNGTSLQGTPVVEAFLSPGSRIVVGETEILFEPKKKWERLAESKGDHFGGLYGTSPRMRAVFGMLAKVAPTNLSCVIVGETGTGKELAARAIHDASPRASRPFIVVDCGAINENLIESELFGHEKGSFTGADRQRIGAFETAQGGTIFLDEIGELPLELQPKLLRALEMREVKRLGATRAMDIDVRVIAATHRDLLGMITKGTFREDLYYRLAEVVLELPPLRERAMDIPLIISRMIAEQAQEGSKVKNVDPEVIKELSSRPWRGNVRELRNVLRRALALAPASTLQLSDLAGTESMLRSRGPSEVAGQKPEGAAVDVAEELPIKEARDRWVNPMEREYLVRLVRRCQGDLDLAAQQAGVHRKSLERLLRQHGIRAAELRTK